MIKAERSVPIKSFYLGHIFAYLLVNVVYEWSLKQLKEIATRVGKKARSAD